MAAVTEEVSSSSSSNNTAGDLDPLIDSASDDNTAMQTGFKDEFSDELDCEAPSEGEDAAAEQGGDDDKEGSNNGKQEDKDASAVDEVSSVEEATGADEESSVDNEDESKQDVGDKTVSGEEDQDTEGDDINDAEEIEAGDSLEETEFVEGEGGEETELVEDEEGCGVDDDPLVSEDHSDPLVSEDPLLDAETDPLMDTQEGDEMLEDGEEMDQTDETEINGMGTHPVDETEEGMEEEGVVEEEEEMVEGEEDEQENTSPGGTKRKSSDQETADVSVRKSSRIKLKNDNRKEKEEALLQGKSVHDKQQEKMKMLQKPTERPSHVLDDEPEQQSDGEKDDDVQEVTEAQQVQGDPSKPPGVGATRKFDTDFLIPFQNGWTREVVVRPVKSGPQQVDIFYWPPNDGEDHGTKNREARRKRRSKVDMEKYFEEFKHKFQTMSVNNFTFVRRPLELNNEAYEIVRHSKPSLETRSDKRTRAASVRYKEVAEHEGLLSGDSSEAEDNEEIEEITDFDQGLPLSLQIHMRTTPFREEAKKRKKIPDRERCVTPPFAEEIEWTVLDDDPLGIYTELGGRSSPATPPPLRAVRLTSHATVTNSRSKLEEIKTNLVDPMIRVKETNKDIKLKENLASHDSAIKKYKNMRVPSHPFVRHSQVGGRVPGGAGGVPRLSGNRPASNNRGGGSVNNRVQYLSAVKVKLPILSTNGKRPSVELVMLTNGKYQPIKFTNNRQVTESIPKRLFEQANTTKKTFYQRSVQVPKIGTKPVFVAVNPSPMGFKPFLSTSANNPPAPTAAAPNPQTSQQVSILVRPARGGNAVLLNVPKAVALKVKVGTTLSFSASSDSKYTVIDNKMHPPVGGAGAGGGGGGAPKKTPNQRSNSNTQPSHRPNKLPQLPAGVSIRPISRVQQTNGGGGRSSLGGTQRNSGGSATVTAVPSQRNHQQSKHVRRSLPAAPPKPPPQQNIPTVDLTDFTPCSPFCPGVTGIPELECSSCHSLFHPKCVGIPQSMVSQIRTQFQCKSCRSRPGGSAIQVIELD